MTALINEQKRVTPLVGEELILRVKELGKLNRTEKAKACGYYSVNKKGLERVNMKQFLNALVDAEGIELDENDKVKKDSEATSTTPPASVQATSEANSVQVIKVNRNSKTVAKPKIASQPLEQQDLQVESVPPVEIGLPEHSKPVIQWESLAEPLREESLYGTGWSLAQLMNEFSGR